MIWVIKKFLPYLYLLSTCNKSLSHTTLIVTVSLPFPPPHPFFFIEWWKNNSIHHPPLHGPRSREVGPAGTDSHQQVPSHAAGREIQPHAPQLSSSGDKVRFYWRMVCMTSLCPLQDQLCKEACPKQARPKHRNLLGISPRTLWASKPSWDRTRKIPLQVFIVTGNPRRKRWYLKYIISHPSAWRKIQISITFAWCREILTWLMTSQCAERWKGTAAKFSTMPLKIYIKQIYKKIKNK